MLLTKGQMMKVEKRKYKTITVDELGGEIRIASISAGCGLEMNEAAAKADQRAQALSLFTSSIVDEQGSPVFDEDEAAKFVNAISVETMTFITSEIVKLSGGEPKKKAAANGVAGAEVPEANPSSAARSESSPTA